jgi:hypothetical protein
MQVYVGIWKYTGDSHNLVAILLGLGKSTSNFIQ